MAKRIIIADTNWWISLVVAKFDNTFATILEIDELEFCSCLELEDEIRQTFTKARLRKYLSRDITDSFWLLFHLRTRNIKLTSRVTICRDPKDNYLLALAKDANADYLITGDKDLLIIGSFENTTICTLNDFINYYLRAK